MSKYLSLPDKPKTKNCYENLNDMAYIFLYNRQYINIYFRSDFNCSSTISAERIKNFYQEYTEITKLYCL